eukprot:CAMPEP_0184699590 /NCGR_PEP_ID=MMETSP0313-20130426/5818_1 /TAXON_ID=2792 /ORGANISM="Porphyridium aerugineum, Strain SAG 1380-2" /LENGTH=270 /DNA_ID=CAMNT_0027158709 /DNA_START=78 /DNA_END=887 /DNA_ORIENTATION=-
MKRAVFIVMLALGVVSVLGQASCPCRENVERTCVTAVWQGNFGGVDQCDPKTVPCTCYCVYDGTDTKTCLLDEGSTWFFTEASGNNQPCDQKPVLVPDCGASPPTTAPPSIITRQYLCANAVITQGATSFDCTVPPLPCNEQIISAKLDYYQYALYTANISFGPGTTQYITDVELVNTPDQPTWFSGTLPGVRVLGSGIIDSEFGVTTVYREFEANATALTKPALAAYYQTLNSNCNSQTTTFTVGITFNNQNSKANFDDASPRGVTAIT